MANKRKDDPEIDFGPELKPEDLKSPELDLRPTPIPKPRPGYERLDKALITIRESLRRVRDVGVGDVGEYLSAVGVVTQETEKLITDNKNLRAQLKKISEKGRELKKAGRR